MSSKAKTVIAFDLYGTLLSTESIAAELAKLFGDDKAKSVAALWRRYQLEYSWRITSMGIYRSFSDITRAALEHAIAESKLSLSDDDSDRMMKAYNSLHAFPDAKDGLNALASHEAVEAFVFSNGTDDMVRTSVMTSPDLKPHAELFKALITVEDPAAFKPARKVYDSLLEKAGMNGRASDVWLVTSNPFDVVGARAAGWNAAWIDRTGTGWVDRLGEAIGDIRPTLVVKSVSEAVAGIVKG